MADRIELNPLAPREAIEFFRSKGFAPALQRFDYRDHWREEHARTFVVAKAMQDDVLALIRDELDKALSNGTTLEAFQNDLAPRLRAQGWWGRSTMRDPLTGELRDVELGSMRRLKVIFDTNMRTSYAAGQWARLQRTKAFLPFLEYRQLARPTARDAHKPFNGLILPIDHPIWGKIFPPNGWFCGCYVRPVNQRMLEREGKQVTTDAELAEIASAPWTNPRTGETEDLLEGLDPAFASNPGAAWLDTGERHAASRLDLPDSFPAYDHGYLREMAALRMRDLRDVALVYSLRGQETDQPVGMTRGAVGTQPAMPDAAMDRALAAPDEAAVLLRAAASGRAIPLADLERFGGQPGLSQIALTSPDGSIFRIGRVAGRVFPASQTVAASHARITAEATRQADRLGIGPEDLELIIAHALAQALAGTGDVQYAVAPSGRVAFVLELASDLISTLISIAFGR